MARADRIQHIAHRGIIYPDFLVTSILDINTDLLRAYGITHLIFDIDETLVPKQGSQLSEEFERHLIKLRKAGISLYIGSNSRRDLSSIADVIGAKVIAPTLYSFKPLKSYYQTMIMETGVEAKYIAMVGDKIINDVIGANYAGLTTFLVDAIKRRPSCLHRKYIKFAQRPEKGT